MPLALASAIVAAPETQLEGFENAVDELRRLSLETVTARELKQKDRLYVLQALLAFEGDKVWGGKLNALNDEEFDGTCLHCGASLLIRIPGNTQPRAVDDLPPLGARLRSFATEGGDDGLAGLFCKLFGRTRCAECDQALDVAEAIAKN